MMQLQYNKSDDSIQEIKERLETLTLAHKIIESEDFQVPSLVDGSKEYRGLDKMNEYLDMLDREKEQWYYCSC